MQDAAFSHWSSMVSDSDDENVDLDEFDFGFHNPLWYVLQTGQVWVLSNFIVMPSPGGWDDQDASWCDDMITYLRGLNITKKEMSPEAQRNQVSEDAFKPWDEIVT